jgi:hypothetical protein
MPRTSSSPKIRLARNVRRWLINLLGWIWHRPAIGVMRRVLRSVLVFLGRCADLDVRPGYPCRCHGADQDELWGSFPQRSSRSLKPRQERAFQAVSPPTPPITGAPRSIQVLRPDRIGAGRCLDQQWYPAHDPGKCDDLPPGSCDPRPGCLPRQRSATPRDRCLGIQPNLGKFDIAGDVKLPKIATCTHHARRSG